jgi:hypothetical protein
MTSEIGVERVGEQQFLFHCSCGATIETSQKREACPDCRATSEVIRCVPTPDGKKYTLRISKHNRGRSQEPLLWPLDLHRHSRPVRHNHEEAINKQLFRAIAATPPTRRYHYTPNYERRFVDLGLLILLAPLWAPLLWMILVRVSTPVGVDPDRSSPQVVEIPKPTDCGWFSGCHYERQVIHVNDKHGNRTIVEWQRVND